MICLIGVACADDPAPSGPPQARSSLPRDLDPQVSAAAVDELVDGDRAFAAALYGEIRSEPGNLFFAPYSISTAMRMVFAGAVGDTEAELAAALRFTLPEPELHAAANRVDLELAARAEVADADVRPFVLDVVNAVWADQLLPVEEPFLDVLASHYGAGVYLVDFVEEPEASRLLINDWIASATDDRIRDLLSSEVINGRTRVVLVNAVSFSAAWDHPFAEADTAPGTFTTTTAGVVEVPMLRQLAPLRTGVGAGFRAVELPYDGDQLAMVVAVPDAAPGEPGAPLDALDVGLTGDTFDAILASLQPARVALTLPRFRLDAGLDVAKPLKAMGAVTPFVPFDADFSGIAQIDLYISAVIHRGVIAIDERGTDAAAATVVVVTEPPSAPPPPPPPVEVTVDRPFLFFIIDRPTGAILFLGRVVDPR